MYRFLPIVTLLLATACGSTRSLPTSESSRVEVRTETIIQHDTAYVELPIIIEKRATLDTSSTIENTYAKSEAVVAAGILHHSLETKPVSVPVKVEKEIVYRDSLVYRDRIETVTVEGEKKLTAWQQTKMKTGEVTMVICLLCLITLITYCLLNLLKLKRL
ncbi:MAG: hypothetical protein IJL93_01980 [Bacteroidales bacterium]|nr:hypothetical protein [Bacteroidales bacterium]